MQGSGGTALLILHFDTCEFDQLHAQAKLLPGNNHYAMKRSYSGKNLLLGPETKP
jgi:hypothetical protein